jgi:hypothetical protein
MYEVPDKEGMIDYAVQALQVLAADARVQVTLYPPFCCPLQAVSDEGDAELPALMDNYRNELTDVQCRAVEGLQAELQAATEADLDCSGGPPVTELPEDRRWEREREILENPHWTKVRLLAREALAAFGRERRDPIPAGKNESGAWQGPASTTWVPARPPGPSPSGGPAEEGK